MASQIQKRILVTGGAGFLGSHLCESLLTKGDYVICVDNFFTGQNSNINHLTIHKNFELIKHDITYPLYLEVDQIYNLACPASPIHYQKDPVKTIKTAVHGAINMLGLAKRTGAIIFQASTSEVYGDPLVHPQTEEYYGNVNPIGPRGVYDEAKRFQEAITMAYNSYHGVETRIVRIFNTYGPRMRLNDGRVLPAFIGQALRGEDLTVFGDGSQTRSFCYVDDLVDGLIKLMNADHTGPINIGNPGEFTIKQLAELVRERINPALDFVFKPLPQDDPLQRQPVIELACSELGWTPSVQLADGLDRTIADFRQRHEAPQGVNP